MERNDRFTAEENKLLAALGRGENAARTQTELTAITGFDARTTRKLLESARKRGAVICGSDAGRYLPETVEELRRYVKRIRADAENELAALAAAEKLLEKWEGSHDR